MQSDEHKDQAIQDEVQGLPHRPGLKADLRRKEPRTPAAEIKSAGHDGQYAGGAQAVRREIGGVGNQYADGDFDGAVVNAAFDPVDDPARDQAHGQAAKCQVGQPGDAGGHSWSFVPQHDGDAEFQGQQTSGVVHQAFAFNQGSDPLGNADAFSD